MAKKPEMPPGKFLGQVAERFHILHQWDGDEWVRVPDYRPGEEESPHVGFIRFDVADVDPADRERERADSRVFKP